MPKVKAGGLWTFRRHESRHCTSNSFRFPLRPIYAVSFGSHNRKTVSEHNYDVCKKALSNANSRLIFFSVALAIAVCAFSCGIKHVANILKKTPSGPRTLRRHKSQAKSLNLPSQPDGHGTCTTINLRVSTAVRYEKGTFKCEIR
eukprot:1555747-Pleurochrysis_carterae.AAC.3